MILRTLALAAALGLVAAIPTAYDAAAQKRSKAQRDYRAVDRDCTPYNGPFGYRGNPWCDGGYKYAEDYPPGAGRYFDFFELPQVRRHTRRWN